MSVVRMIIADDQHYVSGEPHGSDAMRIYAACSRHPQNLAELERLLPEFDYDTERRAFSYWNDGIELEPFDAGLIIVDLAKKWIYAQDSYFGAHRRGNYQPREEKGRTIEYEFSKEWQFVAEPKWFRYLESLGLKPYGDARGPAYEKTEYAGFTNDDFALDDEEPETALERSADEFEDHYAGPSVTYLNRTGSLVEFEPQNADEQRDYYTLEHIAGYDEKVAIAQHHLTEARQKIASLSIELQAVENLRKRDMVPRWEIKHIALQARLDKHDQNISRWTEDHTEAAAMAAELRNLLVTEKGRQMLKMWEEKEQEAWVDMEIPF